MEKLTIVHISLASSFTENMSYQENFLTNQNIKDGHKVVIISNASKFVDGKLVDVPEEDTILPNGLRLIRLKYSFFVSKTLSKKIKKVKGLYNLLLNIKPDIIFSHSTSYYSLLDCIKYKKNHKNIHFVADNHASKYNSGKNFWSDFFLHKGLYKFVTRKALKYLDAYYYIGIDEKRFAMTKYKVPDELLSFYPLGGYVANDEQYKLARNKTRELLGCSEETILFVHSGKMSEEKKTKQLIQSFSKVKDERFMLIIIGSFDECEQEKVMELIKKDERIRFLGWKNSQELFDYLCAGDVYCQPGSVSATLQNSICCRCAIMSFPHDNYVLEINNNNFYWVREDDDITCFFEDVSNNNVDIEKMKNKSYELAKKVLNYEQLAQKLYNDCGYKI